MYMEEQKVKSIGTCPVCGKGQMVIGSLGYSCNYFRNMQDKCTFNIYHTYWGKEITEEIAKQLIEKGETDVYHDFVRKDGTQFSAALKIEDGKIVPKFTNETLEHKCPKCGGNVEKLLSGYACENYNKKDNNGERLCCVFIPKTVARREIPQHEAEVLLSERKTPFLHGFKANSGEEFSARLILNDEYKLSFDNSICKCPKCGGNIYVGKKAYNCSNYKNESIKCDFVIWKEMSQRKISPEEVIQLCENRETNILTGFRDKEGNSIERKLVLNEEFKVKLI